MIVILTGKTASGKSTTAKLMEEKGFNRIVTDTTRPKRLDEIDGIDYNFRTVEEFEKLKTEGYYAEVAEYEATFGHCYYGSSKKAYESEKDSVIVLNPYGLKMVLKNLSYNKNIISVYLSLPDDVLIKRLRKRGDKEEEIKRRIKHDNEDFKCMSKLCDYTLLLGEEDTEEEILNSVLDFVKTS